MYTYQAYALLYARSRLQKGLPTTFEVRKKCALDTFRCLTIYGVYLLILVFMFLIITSDPSPQPDSGIAKFSMFFLFIISNRGSVDGIAWFVLHDFGSQKSESKSGKYAYEKIESSIPENALSVSTDKKSTVHHRKSKIDVVELKHNVEEIKHKVTNTITELADLAIAELDEADLSPQVNTALRQQIVHYVTKGVRNAVLNIDTDKKPFTEFKDVMDSLFQFKGIDLADVKGLTKLEFLLDGEYPFKAYAPEIFTQLRGIEGINDDRYLSVLSASANERLSEGASGAFMFFCGGGEFIVKTIRAREAQVLHSSLLTYSKYLKKYRDSLLCRILGSYSLELYNQVFYFVVMLNCFDPHAYINDRYDIKGSWVGRSAEPKKKGKKVVCRHCNEYFIPSKAEQCKAIVGTHEASVVLKDNDLRTKISLHPEEAKRVLKILKRDSELLGKLGVMDYSLLIGVKKWKYEIKITEDMVKFKPDSFQKSGDHLSTETHNGPPSTFHAQTVTGPAIYHFGIIDFFQNWTFQKKVERAAKIYFLRKDPDGLSVMPPLQYKIRFQNKLDQIFDLEGTVGGIGKMDLTPSLEQQTEDPVVQDDINNIELVSLKNTNDDIVNPLQDMNL